jgi:hypothetical protein
MTVPGSALRQETRKTTRIMRCNLLSGGGIVGVCVA